VGQVWPLGSGFAFSQVSEFQMQLQRGVKLCIEPPTIGKGFRSGSQGGRT
jgi:hypothetical protein